MRRRPGPATSLAAASVSSRHQSASCPNSSLGVRLDPLGIALVVREAGGGERRADLGVAPHARQHRGDQLGEVAQRGRAQQVVAVGGGGRRRRARTRAGSAVMPQRAANWRCSVHLGLEHATPPARRSGASTPAAARVRRRARAGARSRSGTGSPGGCRSGSGPRAASRRRSRARRGGRAWPSQTGAAACRSSAEKLTRRRRDAERSGPRPPRPGARAP